MRIVITGANGALAKGTIKHLIKGGNTDITMAVRSLEKGNAAKQEILKSTKSFTKPELTVVDGFDMNDAQKIAHAVQQLEGQQPYDVVFLAAGFAVLEMTINMYHTKGKR